MFLPTCGCCGRCGCQCGVLPHTITAKFSGFTEQTTTVWRTADAVACFGTGAQAAIESPGGKGNEGPIQTVAIRDPGRCYAERDRISPVLRAVGTGTGAVMDVTLVADAADTCGRPRWKISQITTQGGTGYANNSLVTVLPSPGDITLTPAVARVVSSGGIPQSVTLQSAGQYFRPVTGDRDVPILTASVGGGSVLSVSVEQLEGDPPVWKVSGVGVRISGSKVADGASVAFAVGDRTIEQQPATATAVVDADGGVVAVKVAQPGEYYRDTKLPPRVASVSFPFGGGVGGVVEGVVEDDPEADTFGQVVDLKIKSGGTGYLGWTLVNRCQHELNGREIVLRAEQSSSLVTACLSSCFGTGGAVEIVSHVKPRLFGRLPGSSNNDFSVIMEETGAAPKTWRVRRILGGETGGTPGDAVTIVPAAGVITKTAATAVIASVDDNVPIVTVTNAGEYYSQDAIWDGVAGPIPGVRIVESGEGYARLGRLEPTLQGVADQSPMAVTVVSKSDDCGLPFWEVSKITLAGAGVTEGRVLTITGTSGTKIETPALVVIHTRTIPSVTVQPPEIKDVEPAQFTVTLVKSGPAVPLGVSLVQGKVAQGIQSAVWSVSEVVIDNKGKNYPYETRLEFSTEDEQIRPAAALAYADKLGQIRSVAVETGGAYYKDEGNPSEYTIARPGVYYNEDASLQPYVAVPSVQILQLPPSVGVNGEITLSVVSDTASTDFGKLKSATVSKGGSNYQLRGGPGNCVYSHTCPEKSQSVRLRIAAENVSASFVGGTLSTDDPNDVLEPTRWRGVLANGDAVSDCSKLTSNPLIPQLDLEAGQITISAGGQYASFVPCCYCPCDQTVDYRDLVPCGINQIIVVVNVDVADNGDPGRCPSQTVTLTLDGTPGRDMWYAEDVGAQFTTVAFLNCIDGKLFIVGAFNAIACNSALPQFQVELESAAASPDLQTCCPVGGTQKFGDPQDVEVTVSVTTVIG